MDLRDYLDHEHGDAAAYMATPPGLIDRCVLALAVMDADA